MSEINTEVTKEENVEMKVDGGKKFNKKHKKGYGPVRKYLPHLLVCLITYGTLRVVFRNVDSMSTITPMQLHVIFGVLGYQLMMGNGTILISTNTHMALFPGRKKTVHWVMCAVGGVCSVAGTVIMILSRETHFNSIHSLLGLGALIFTGISSLNGVVFLYCKELSDYIAKGDIKFVHTITGTVVYVLSTICLCYGYDKKTFGKWTSQYMAYVLTFICVASICMFLLSPIGVIVRIFKHRYWNGEKEEDKKE